MRINVYSQELTKEIAPVSKVADTGIAYYGVRLMLASPDILHHTPEDDDRSAITFWIPNARSFTRADLAKVFRAMADLTDTLPDPDQWPGG
jgi:hypothetical protein